MACTEFVTRVESLAAEVCAGGVDATPAAGAMERGNLSMSMSNPASKEIFIVDDDPLVLNALSIVLSREGYKVTGFGEGGSFLAAARARTPTCIILDVQMPGQSGLDILRELNAQQYAAPIFIISGIGDIPMAVEAIKSGALDFIEKPFDATTVVTRVREAVEAWARRAQSGGREAIAKTFPGHDLLTARERDV